MWNWGIRSKEESGLGCSDILIEVLESRTSVVIELKYAESEAKAEETCDIALQQTEEKHYDALLLDDGMNEKYMAKGSGVHMHMIATF